MGSSAENSQKNTITPKQTMVAIRVSDNNNDPITTIGDQQNPNKKIKLCVENNTQKVEQDEEDEDEDEDEDGDGDGDEGEDFSDDAVPIGDIIRVSNNCGVIKNHFQSFQFDHDVYHLEDTVLVTPEEGKVKPSVAIIKDIFQDENGGLKAYGGRFYRPEEAEKKEGGTWETHDARELFYSSYIDELDACNVMHKCIIHMVPLGKILPDRKEQPGFIVQKVYDSKTKKIRNLTEEDCEEANLSQPGASETA